MESKLTELLDTVLQHDEFSEDVLRQAEWVIADTVVAALYGLKSEAEVIKYMNDKASDQGNFPILGTNLRTNRKDSLIIHGTAIVANELDEGNTFAKGHPSAHILPALLISAYENDATIDEVLHAYIKAYEISSRLAYASSMRDDMHPHGTWGNVGGAVARALIEKKDHETIKEAVLIVLSLPLSTTWLAAEKGLSVRNLYTGIGSFLAYESVEFAEYGFTSNIAVVDNLWTKIMGDSFTSERLTESLMDPPLITQNYFKVHPTCRFTHAAIDAAAQLINDHSFTTNAIKKVEVETYSLAARCDAKHPNTKLQSKFSIPYAVACTLMDVDMFANYENNLAKVAELVGQITVKESLELTKLLPSKRAARVRITLQDGAKLEQQIDNAQGEYSDKFSEKRMWEKYNMMLVNDYPVAFVEKLQSKLLELRQCATFKQWLQVNQLVEG